MIKILIPDNNFYERKYIIDIIFGEFFGLQYLIESDSVDYYEIKLESGKKLIIEDHFFNHFPHTLEYLSELNLPQKVLYITNEFIVEHNLPVIFGQNGITEKSDTYLKTKIDIFASTFFMLSRWEEYVNSKRDIHGRFSAYDSISYKEKFLNRPIVNEYVEMLWNMLVYLGIEQNRKVRKFRLFITHDVDLLIFWKNKKQLFRIILGDLLKRKSISLVRKRLLEYYMVKTGKNRDPYNYFEWLMEKSEDVNNLSRFYFMTGGTSKFDNRYDINDQMTLDIIEKIQKRGHVIGLHPSYNAFNNKEILKVEKELLDNTLNISVREGREHFLRFEIPTTWQIWENIGLKIDSTCGYADREGFRCGTGDEFSVFNILERKQLELKERPLIFMEIYRHDESGAQEEEKLIKTIKDLINKAEKYNSFLTILFHQSTFANDEVDYKQVYEAILR